jgi:hypothetical protein
MEFMVKKGVKLPPTVRKQPLNRKYPFATMEVDQIFFVPGVSGDKFSVYASQRGRVLNRKFKTQSATMRQDLQTDQWEPCKPGAPGAKQGVAVCRIA